MVLTTHARMYEHVILSSQLTQLCTLETSSPNSLSQLGSLSTS